MKEATMTLERHERRALAFARYGHRVVAAGATELGLCALAEALSLDPKPAATWAAYGLALAKAERVPAACQALLNAVERAPDMIEMWCVLGELCLRHHDYNRATAALARCLALDPHSRHPSGVRARALIHMSIVTLRAAA
jgi:cytochrome c-type biogenesis protein CcmH/NrfG